MLRFGRRHQMIGDTLNHYRVERGLGRGGMGEVYVADDTRLHRKVALKVLPPGLGADAERRQRFEREAQTVAALNHPNIVTIFSVEQAGHIQFLTMELVEGRTLAEVLPSDGLPIATLLQYAVPLADAVSAAHARGIVHRDLKPANVMVTADGRIKVLDFGLAKLKEPVDAGALTTTAADPLTGEGRIVGTAAYMSPEQAEGRPVDHRSDIFSLGVLLYEMATGERPFKGETSLSLLSSIMKDTPRLLSEVKPALPRELGRIVRRCLAKDPGRRYQSALDLRNELEEIKQELDSGELSAGPVDQGRRPASPRRRGTVWLGLGVAVGLSLAAGVAYRWWVAVGPPAPRVERFQLQPPSGVRLAESSSESVLAISPDGLWIAFVSTGAQPGLYLRSTSEVEAQRIGTGGAPFFSADSRWLGFFAEGFLQRIPVGGGQPQRICEAPRLRGASWGDDDTIVYSAGEGLLRVSAQGGTPVPLTSPAPGERHYWPQVLPGQEAVLFTRHRGVHDGHRRVAALSLKTGEIRVFDALSGSSPHYVPDGYLVYSRFGTLYRVGFDPERLQTSGEPRAVLDDVFFYGGSGFTGFDVASSGALVYMPGARRVEDTELVWLDRQGNATTLSAPRRSYREVVISPDGTRLVASIAASHEDQDLWLRDIARDDWTRLTYGQETHLSSPVWSPDGRWIVFTSFKSGNGKLLRIPVDGGTPEQLTSGVDWDYPGGVTPDGTTVILTRQVEASQWDLLTLRLDAPGDPVPFLSTRFLEWWPALSPDGRWVAYQSVETGANQIHVRPYPGPDPRVTVTTNGGQKPFWSHDGRELFYRRGQEVWAAAIAPGGAFKPGAPRLLFRAEFLPSDTSWASLTVAPDGRFLAVRPPRRERTERLLVYVPNWRQELN